MNNAIVCPKIFMQHIWTIFIRNTHTCERIAIEIAEGNNFQDNFIDILSSFNQKNSQERKQIPYGDL